MNPEEWDFILAMLESYRDGRRWNFHDPTTEAILRRFKKFVETEEEKCNGQTS